MIRSIVGYARVSTTEQADTDALEQQINRLNKVGVSQVFIDVESGRSNKRKEFNKLIKQCKENKISEIVITRIDRLARSVITISQTLKTLEDYKIKLTILDAPIDASNPFGWFSINQMAGLAEFESRLLSNRINHGVSYFKEQNKANGRIPLGYIRVEEKYEIDISKLDMILDIIRFFLSDIGTLRGTSNYINNKYNISFTPIGLRLWLLNPVLQGHTAYNVLHNRSGNNRDKIDLRLNTHESIINNDTFNLIKNKLEINKNNWGANTNKKSTNSYPLFSKIICNECNTKCYLVSQRSTNRIRCRKRAKHGISFCSNSKSIYLSEIIKACNIELIKRATDIQELAIIKLKNNEEIINPKLQELYKQLDTLRDLPNQELLQSAIDNILVRINEIEINTSLSIKIDNNLIDVLLKYFTDITFWNTLPLSEQIVIYNSLVKSIKVFNEKIIEIQLNI